MFDSFFDDENITPDKQSSIDDLFDVSDDSNEDTLDDLFDISDDSNEDILDDTLTFNVDEFSDITEDTFTFDVDEFEDIKSDEEESLANATLINSLKGQSIKRSVLFMQWLNKMYGDYVIAASGSASDDDIKLFVKKFPGTEALEVYKTQESFPDKPKIYVMRVMLNARFGIVKQSLKESISANQKKVLIFTAQVFNIIKSYSSISDMENYNKVYTDLADYCKNTLTGIQLDPTILTKSVKDAISYVQLVDKILSYLEDMKALQKIHQFDTTIINDCMDNANTINTLLKDMEDDFWDCSDYVLANNIDYSNDECNVLCDCGESIDFNTLLKFNIVYDFNGVIQDFTKIDVSTINDTFAKLWCGGILDPDSFISNSYNLNIDNVTAIYTALPNIKPMDLAVSLQTAICNAITFNPNAVCPKCGKHLILPDKFLAFIIVWHLSHNNIYRKIKNDTMSRFDSVVTYQSKVLKNMFKIYSEDLKGYYLKILDSDGTLVNEDDSSLQLRLSVDGMNPNDNPNNNIKDDSAKKSSGDTSINNKVREAYDSLRARESYYSIGLLKYREVLKIKDEQLNKPAPLFTGAFADVDYWRKYNTSSDDKLLSTLYYLVNNLNLGYNLDPGYIMSQIMTGSDDTKFVSAVMRQSLFLQIQFNKELLDKYAVDINNENTPIVAYKEDNDIWVIDSYDVKLIRRTLQTLLKNYIKYDVADCTSFVVFSDEDRNAIEAETIGLTDLNRLVSQLLYHYNDTEYQYYRNCKNFRPSVEILSVNPDLSMGQYITDELPWKVWYKLLLLDLIAKYSPNLLRGLSKSKSKNSYASAIKKLEKEIIQGAVKGDLNSGSILWSKLSIDILKPVRFVLNKNLYELSLIYAIHPYPITDRLIALLLQSDNMNDAFIKINNYYKTTYIDDLCKLPMDEENTRDTIIQQLPDVDVLINATISWINNFCSDNFSWAVPKYLIREED